MIKYYLHLENEQKGPFSVEQLQEMWKAGEINAHTQFWTKANNEWRMLETIIGMFNSAEPAAPMGPPDSPNAAPATGKVASVTAATAVEVERGRVEPKDQMAGLAAYEPGSASKRSRALPKSFPILSFLSTFMRWVGWVLVLFGLVYEVLYEGIAMSPNQKVIWMAIYTGLMTALIGLGCIIYGEIVGVAFSIEENTFKTARSLDEIAEALHRIARQSK